jgi:hypothetical protein
MRTYLLPSEHVCFAEIDDDWPPGICVVLTVLARLNEDCTPISIGKLAILFEWTKEKGVQLLMQECRMTQDEALVEIECLVCAGYVYEKNGANITHIFN